ncbi:MAG: dihydroxy-acid dehydratase [Clostridiales bacterium]|jgi:dihydroxy-acid dehydratase|nr:dihydroxy-acid dehydratase [Clostridiales bacterium]
MQQLQGVDNAGVRAIYSSMGLTQEDTKKNIIGIILAHSSIDYSTHIVIDNIKQGILSKDCVPLTFCINCLDDGITGHNVYSLPNRELIADTTESTILSHNLDGVVLVANHDIAIAGLLMGALRTNVPLIVSSIGAGNSIDNNTGITQVLSSISRLKSGTISIDQLTTYERQSLGNNTYTHMLSMPCLCEALGISLIGNGTIPCNTNLRCEISRQAGLSIVNIVNESIQPKMILTKQAFDNAVTTSIAISASLDTVLHLIAIGLECGIKLGLDNWSHTTNNIPTIVALHALQQTSVDFCLAGGVGAVLQQLINHKLVDGTTMTINMQSLSQNVSQLHSNNDSVIHDINSPYLNVGSIAIIKGNIARDGAILRRTPNNYNKPFVGKCKTFDSASAAISALSNHAISQGDAIIVKYEGPKAGMRDIYSLYALLHGYGLSDYVAIVTDGRLSYAEGICVGYTSPEVYCEGELGLVQDGDKLTIDATKSKIELDINAKEFKHRYKKFDIKSNYTSGWLNRYCQVVQSANKGATLIKS